MRKALGTLLFFILLPVLAIAAPIKVVSWNLQWFPGGQPKAKQAAKKEHMLKAQEALKMLNPDVICLQEVKDWAAAEELVSAVPGLELSVISNFKGDQQQVIASKLPADSGWYENWNSSEVSDIPRGYSFAALKRPDGGFLLVYSLHMKANGGKDDAKNIAKREEAARQLASHAEAMKALYGRRGKVDVILAGDWNTTLDEDPRFAEEKTMRALLQAGYHTAWENVPFEQRMTHPASGPWPAITFDHILTSWKNAPAQLGAQTGVSDHLPVVLVVEPGAIAPPAAAAPIPGPGT